MIVELCPLNIIFKLFYSFPGSNNDAGIFGHSDLGNALANEQIHLPAEQFLPRSDVLCPFYLIGDREFPLKKYLMKPFVRNNNLTVPQQVYNYRLSHARRIIESAFGELSQVWRVFFFFFFFFRGTR